MIKHGMLAENEKPVSSNSKGYISAEKAIAQMIDQWQYAEKNRR